VHGHITRAHAPAHPAITCGKQDPCQPLTREHTRERLCARSVPALCSRVSVCDARTVPLCALRHDRQHTCGIASGVPAAQAVAAHGVAAFLVLSGQVRVLAFCPISCILHDSRHAARKVRATSAEWRNSLRRSNLRRRHGALARFSPRCRVDRRRSRAIPGGALPLATGHRLHTRWRGASLAEP
jgi:hypothetical protein